MAELLPVGQRPKCKACGRELRPQFVDDEPRPWFHASEDRAAKEKAWKKAHRHFSGHYGDYSDDNFCGLNCGYRYAVRITKGQK